jgi:hypothetical protein
LLTETCFVAAVEVAVECAAVVAVADDVDECDFAEEINNDCESHAFVLY